MNNDDLPIHERFTPKQLRVLKAEPQVTSAVFSPDGKWLLAGGFDSRLRRWNVEHPDVPEQTPIEGHGGWVTALAFPAQAASVLSADSWGQIRCTPLAGDRPTAFWSNPTAHDGWIRDLAMSPDGTLVASCGADKKVRLWTVTDGNPVREFATGSGPTFAPRNGDAVGDVSRVRFAPDGKSLVTADMKGIVKAWDCESGELVREFNAGLLFKLDRLQDVGGVCCMAFDRDGKWLACGGTQPKGGGTVTGQPTLLVFDFSSGELKYTLTFGQPNDCYVMDVAFHDAGFIVVVTSGTPGSGKLLFQRLEDDKPFFELTKLANCHSLSFHAASRRLAVTATNGGSNGNGRQLKDGQYLDNHTPIHLFELGV